jgi:hypothetical protein
MTSTIFKSYPLENDPEMAALILAGLPATVLRKVAAFLGLRPAKIGPLVNINEKTLERRLEAHARLKPDESERVARLMRIISFATTRPADWRRLPAPLSTREAATRWVAEARSAVLQVPSIVMDGEFNYILNPRHADFARLEIGEPLAFSFDPRLSGV